MTSILLYTHANAAGNPLAWLPGYQFVSGEGTSRIREGPEDEDQGFRERAQGSPKEKCHIESEAGR